MAGGRPKKKIDRDMTYLAESLEEVEHVSDRYYELFNQLAAMDRTTNPEEYDRVEAEADHEWDKSIRMTAAPAYSLLKDLVFDKFNGLRDKDRKILTEMKNYYEKSEPAFFSEAHWISKWAHVYAKRFLKAFKSKVDVEVEYRDIAQNVVMAILTSGKYDYMQPKKAKAAYIKKMVEMRFTDYARAQQKYNERFSSEDIEHILEPKKRTG